VNQDLDPKVLQFLQRHIRSVATLDMLLLLHSIRPMGWNVEKVASELRVEPRWASAQLEEFATAGFVQRDEQLDTWSFHASSSEVGESVSLLAQAYLLHRVRVIELIYARPESGVAAFAHAFHWKRRPSGG